MAPTFHPPRSRSRLRAAAVLALCAAASSTTASATPWDPFTAECAPNVPPPLQPHGRFGCPVPLDDGDARALTRHSPWTHPPHCVNASAAVPGRPARRGGGGPKYCVYTNSRHGVRGVSIVTTPEAAADSIDLLNEAAAPAVAAFPPARGGGVFDRDDPPYAIVDVAGKGKGVVATRAIRRYETLMVDYASMLVDLYFPSTVPRHHGYVLLNTALDQLDDPLRVMGLGRNNPQAGNPVEDVLRTNAYQTDLGGEPHMVIFPEIARINHACQPNLVGSVAALRDIKKGEEITVSYLTLGQTYADRQRGLQRWSFQCKCALCSGSSEATAASDTRRVKLQAKREQAQRAYSDGSGERALELTEEMIALLREEDLELLLAEQYENTGRIHWAMGDRVAGERWARRSLDLLSDQGYLGEVRPGMLRALLRNYEQDVENSKHPSERGSVAEPELQQKWAAAASPPSEEGGKQEAEEEGEEKKAQETEKKRENPFRRRFEEEVAKLKAKMAEEGAPTATLTPWKERQAQVTGTPEQNQKNIEELKKQLKRRLQSLKQKGAKGKGTEGAKPEGETKPEEALRPDGEAAGKKDEL